MEDQTIGVAKIDVKVDNSQLLATVEASKRSVAGMSADAQAQYNKLDSVEKRRVDRLLKQADTLGMTRAEQLAYNAALRTSGPLLDELNRKIGQNEARLKASGVELNRYGVSAKQQAAAMRGVPAQLTDIFVGLQGGQNPLTVLLQQGGQLKDMFGGIVPAARALGGALFGLVNPATLTAGAIIGVVAALEQGREQLRQFDQQLILTGNYANTSADELLSLARKLDGLSGTTQSEASAVLASLAGSGKYTAEQIELVATAALQMQDATGKAIEETVAEFEQLRRDPVKAILDLNDKYHFLTSAQLENIESLKEQGREQDAVTEAFRIHAGQIADRTPEIVENIGLISGAWRGLKNSALEAWDGVVTGLQEADREAKQGLDTFGRLMSFFRSGMPGGPLGLNVALATPTATRAPASNAVDSRQAQKERDERKKAEEEWGRLVTSNLSKREKLEREIADIRKAGEKSSKSEAEIQAQIAQARARFAESEKKASSGSKVNPAESLIRRLQQQNALNEEQIKTGEKLSTSERLIVQVREELERITGKVSAADKARVEALLGEVRVSGEAVEQFTREAKAKESLARQNAILAQQGANRRSANELDLARYGLGDDAVQQMQRRLDIDREYTAELKRLGDRSVADDQSAWDRMASNAQLHRDQQLREEEEYQRQRAALMGDWRNGATSAIADFVFKANDSAAQWYSVWSNSLNGLTDLMVKFATTGKASFKDLATSILTEISRIMMAKAVAGFVDMLIGLFGGFGGTNAGTKTGVNTKTGSSAKGFAKGGAFSGSPSLSAYSGQVVDKPTMFAFANGGVPNMGLMGEAGSEAIMPLKRLPDGRLGVHSTGGRGTTNVTTIVNVNADGSVETNTQADNEQTGRLLAKMIEAKVTEVMARESRQGGLLWKQKVGAYG